MNYNKNVVVFTLVFTIILFGYSILAAIYPGYSFGLDNLSIVADVVKVKAIDSTLSPTLTAKTDSVKAANGIPSGPKDINNYLKAKTLTAFYTDTNRSALPQLMRKLAALKADKKGKVRIAWFGDSFIEGDQLTKTFRREMQQYFGGYGVGFVPVTSVTVDGFRSTISQKWTGDWKEENFKTKGTSAPLFFSGRLYYAANGNLTLKDFTPGKDSTQLLEKSLICGYSPTPINITVNGQAKQYAAPQKLNRIVVDNSISHNLNINIQNDRLPVYGISMEPQSGVVVDNFSFRGISGEELGKLDTNFIKTIQEQNTYDLVVLEYGVNVLYRPDNTDFAWHKRNMTKVLQRLHAAMPNTEFLVISTSDRGFRYGDGPRSAVGINNLVKTQAEMAFENGMSFFNMFASMGGAGTIVRWADSTPTLAGHDYVHPNPRGAEILGMVFYNAFMKDYEKSTKAPSAALPQQPVAVPQPATVATVAPVTADVDKPAPAAPQNHYKTTAYGSIIDKRTGIEWMIAEDRNYTWDEAQQWAANLTAGNVHWALPSINQIITLYDSTSVAGEGFVYTDGKTYPAKISSAFNKIGHGSWIWSAQEVDSAKAFSVNLNQNRRIKSSKNKTAYPVRVFAVKKTEPTNTAH